VDNEATPNTPNVVYNYTYDAVGNRLSRSEKINGQSGANLTYTSDKLNRLTSMTEVGTDGSVRLDFSYDAASQLTSITKSANNKTGPSCTYSYDHDGRPLSITHTIDGAILSSYNLEYDAASRLTQLRSSVDGTSNFTYDQANELVTATHDGQPDESYGFDANGNRQDETISGDNALISDTNFNYTYDGDGNLTSWSAKGGSNKTNYSWDHRHRLTSAVTKDGSGNVISQASYVYDAFDRRIAKTVDADGAGPGAARTEKFSYDLDNIAVTFD